MPTPREGESQSAFVERCIPIVLDDGTVEDDEQAVAVCFQMWEDRDKQITDPIDDVRWAIAQALAQEEDKIMSKQEQPSEHKSFPSIVTKVDEAQGIVDHIVAVMGNLDLGGDIIHLGAFTKTISERMHKIRVLDSHNAGSIMSAIGTPIHLWEVGAGQLPPDLVQQFPDASGALMARTQFLMNTPEGKGAFERIKAKAVGEYSIGYDPVDVDFSLEDSGGEQVNVRHLRSVKLYEYSPVLWGMNEATMTVSAKAQEDDDSIVPPCDKASAKDYEVKARNLGQFVNTVVRSFYSKFPDSMHVVYWVKEIWDEFVIIEQEGAAGNKLWKVPYVVTADGEPSFSNLSLWQEVSVAYVPISDATPKGKEAKIGRAISKRNAERIRAAVQSIADGADALLGLLADAGITDEQPEQEEEASKSAPEQEREGVTIDGVFLPWDMLSDGYKEYVIALDTLAKDVSKDSQMSGEEAGPDIPPTSNGDDVDLALLEIQKAQLELSMLEV